MFHKKGIDKKLLFGAAQGLNSQFLNLFGFSISVSFVWCIIYRIWTHLGKVIVVFRRGMCFLALKFSRKTAIKNASVSQCFRNSSLTIIWNNLGLSNYNRIKRKLGFKKITTRNTCYNFKKELFSPLLKRESSYSDAFVASLNHSIVLGRIFC